MRLFWILLALWQLNAFSNPSAEVSYLPLAQTKKWKKLLHWENPWFSSRQSKADGKEFFLSPRGKHSLEEELLATVQAFQEPIGPDPNSHARCRFPMRFRWLQLQIPELQRLPPISCPLYERFYQSIDPSGVSLVFSSYFMGNPSSVFGHTFLRVHRKQSAQFAEKAELLDSGVNYAANPTTHNALVYSILGLIGGYPGTYAKLPYYYKVREYAESESRDLWSYELNLSTEQLDDLIRHLWELGQTHFDYYFLSENCSYHILAALEAIEPEWELTSKLPFYVIPSETVKVINQVPGLVKSYSFRPSARRLFLNSYDQLSSKERAEFKRLIRAGDPATIPLETSEQSRRALLDASIDYIDYKHSKDLFREEKAALDLKRKFLSERAKWGNNPERTSPSTPLNELPHEGHDTQMFKLSGGYSEREYSFYELSHRFAFHQKEEFLAGYPPDTSIEILSFRLRGPFKSKFPRLENFTLVAVESLTPVQPFELPISWKTAFQVQRSHDTHCSSCLPWSFSLETGFTWRLFWETRFYVLGHTELSGSSSYNETYLRTGIGPKVGLYRPLLSWFALRAESQWVYHPRFDKPWVWQFHKEARFLLTKNWNISVDWRRYQLAQEYLVSSSFYF